MAIALSERAPNLNAAPLPEKIAALVHEARWLVAAVAATYLALILWGFDKADPGWSHAALVDRIANPGGRAGAWLADILLYIFGVVRLVVGGPAGLPRGLGLSPPQRPVRRRPAAAGHCPVRFLLSP